MVVEVVVLDNADVEDDVVVVDGVVVVVVVVVEDTAAVLEKDISFGVLFLVEWLDKIQ